MTTKINSAITMTPITAEALYKKYKRLGLEVPESVRKKRNRQRYERERELANGAEKKAPGNKIQYHDKKHARWRAKSKRYRLRKKTKEK